ncbi:DUF1512 domain-containing protein [Candidatus Korarchaeum cryptofilum]|uniref:DUF1512 domain-containing protein n=1 Tax=Candidatus Korarchaeum cryptofilum TaxID=498846 RepID=A0A3R9PRC3_9CREN|nr:DUF1512 domain-containing protein [Candidatus Korarchaeum cryptofilum]RSN69550.1 DUF1512 domain-containing protein [Candidatus Korarchaeum cryptofilum]
MYSDLKDVRLMQVGQGDWLSWIFFIIFIMIMQFYANRLQAQIWISEISRALSKLEEYSNDSARKFIEEASKYGRSQEEVKSIYNKVKGFFLIEPVTLDPYGAVRRLEHLLNTMRDHLNALMKDIAPNADGWKRSNLRDQMASALTLDMIYRIIRHYFILGRKTQNLIYIAQIQMLLPEIMRIAKAYWKAGDAFRLGIPIGDGIGPLVALKLMNGAEFTEIAENIVGAEVDIEGRRVMVIKAKGPGSEVGRPGLAIERIVEGREGKVSLIITIDAASKLEGEPTAEIAEGIGAAIGDPGPEKYKIEEVATKYAVPLHAIAIKEDQLDAITSMSEEIARSVDEVIGRVKATIVSKTLPGDYVIVAGIGNTMGIGNRMGGA